MFIIYSLLYGFALSFLLIPEILKRPRGARVNWLRNKLGFYPECRESIWIHAVSVGEVGAIIPLLRLLKEKWPKCDLVISTITDTGYHVAKRKAPLGTVVCFLPFDLTPFLFKAFNSVRPRMLIVVETEIWPNLVSSAAEKGIPVIMLNGRISEKSMEGYARISFFIRHVLEKFVLFGMQSTADAERIKKIGAESHKVSVIGNFKFDFEIDRKVPLWASKITGPVLVAGSTHRGEEEIILSAYSRCLKEFPSLKLIIAPRHPERFEEVRNLLMKSGLPFMQRTTMSEDAVPGLWNQAGFVLMLDSIGELSLIYGIADIAIIGKSFLGYGGQNPLEAAFWGKPIVCGPNMQNFSFISDFYEAGGAFETDSGELFNTIVWLLRDSVRVTEAGARARQVFDLKSGATTRALQEISSIVEKNELF